MPVEIRSTGRSALWYQVSDWELGSPRLRERLQRIALADWIRHDGKRQVIVTAVERGSGAAASMTLEPFVFASF